MNKWYQHEVRNQGHREDDPKSNYSIDLSYMLWGRSRDGTMQVSILFFCFYNIWTHNYMNFCISKWFCIAAPKYKSSSVLKFKTSSNIYYNLIQMKMDNGSKNYLIIATYVRNARKLDSLSIPFSFFKLQIFMWILHICSQK